jgi:CHASE2 domain-containing sensor protein
MELGDAQNESFFLGVLHAVAGVSFLAGLHEIDALLLVAPPVVALSFLTLSAASLVSALLAAAARYRLRPRSTRRLASASVTLLVAGYALLIAGGWYTYITDPDMFQNGVDSAVFKT